MGNGMVREMIVLCFDVNLIIAGLLVGFGFVRKKLIEDSGPITNMNSSEEIIKEYFREWGGSIKKNKANAYEFVPKYSKTIKSGLLFIDGSFGIVNITTTNSFHRMMKKYLPVCNSSEISLNIYDKRYEDPPRKFYKYEMNIQSSDTLKVKSSCKEFLESINYGMIDFVLSSTNEFRHIIINVRSNETKVYFKAEFNRKYMFSVERLIEGISRSLSESYEKLLKERGVILPATPSSEETKTSAKKQNIEYTQEISTHQKDTKESVEQKQKTQKYQEPKKLQYTRFSEIPNINDEIFSIKIYGKVLLRPDESNYDEIIFSTDFGALRTITFKMDNSQIIATAKGIVSNIPEFIIKCVQLSELPESTYISSMEIKKIFQWQGTNEKVIERLSSSYLIQDNLKNIAPLINLEIISKNKEININLTVIAKERVLVSSFNLIKELYSQIDMMSMML